MRHALVAAGYAARALRCLAVVFLACGLTACASAHLRSANGAATSGIAALASANTAYDAALAPRMDRGLAPYVTPLPADALTGAALRTLNTQDRDYAVSLQTLAEHAKLLSAYFTVLSDYTAPGSTSATKHTDAQLAQAGGIATAIKAVNARLGAGANIVTRLAIEANADAGLRRHLDAHSEDVVEGLLIQKGAMTEMRTQMTQNRSLVCAKAMQALNASALPTPPRPLTQAEATQLNDRRRTAIACNRAATEAVTAGAALDGALRAYVDVAQGRVSPETAPLVINNAADLITLGKNLLSDPPKQADK